MIDTVERFPDPSEGFPEVVTGRNRDVPGTERNDPDQPFLLDLRSRSAFQRGHLRGSSNLPAAQVARSLFVLPPRDVPIVLIHPVRATVERVAAVLLERGWANLQIHILKVQATPPEGWATGRIPHRGWRPAPFLEEALHITGDIRGMAIDLACGAGRNAVRLGLRGTPVLGVDILPDSVRQAMRLARLAGAPRGRVRFRTLDLTAHPERVLRPGRYAAVLCFRFLDRRLFPLMAGALAPGGWLVLQTFLIDQRAHHGKPRREAHLLERGELKASFSRLEPHILREGCEPDGNWYGSFLARNPGH